MIYLDNAATTKPSNEVIRHVAQSLEEDFFNPASLHRGGLNASNKLIFAKEEILKVLNAQNMGQIYFTSGGTESNNIAIQGIPTNKKQVITTMSEHPSVLNVVKSLKSRGYKVDYVPLNKYGVVIPSELKPLLSQETALVAIMHTNNETGAINDLKAIGELIKSHSNALFHVDAVASFTKCPINIQYIDTLSISSHKIHGIGGIGAIYIKKGVNIKPIFYGGSAHNAVRPCTENVTNATAFALAACLANKDMDKNYAHIQGLNKEMQSINVKKLHINSPTNINCNDVNYLPYILNISITGTKGQVIVNELSEIGIYISTGAACNGKGINILKNLGYEQHVYDSALRISFSKYNTIQEIKQVKQALTDISSRQTY